MRLDIKPLSVNQAWQGKRFKTPAYKQYERDVMKLLRNTVIPEGEFGLRFVFGFSNMQSDIDNPLKPMMDILQKKYGFNDSRVTRLDVQKVKTKKGQEFIDFAIIGAVN